MEKKVAVITGAAQGIGKEIALQLAEDGCIPVICDINEAALEQVASLMAELGYPCDAYVLDVRHQEEVFKLVEQIVQKYGKLDVMVANAGVVQVKPFVDITEADMEKLFSVNVNGAMYCMQAAAKQMKKQEAGKIIVASSTSGKRAVELLGHYAATKFAVIGLMQAAAKELAPFNITVNAYCPGIVGTSMWEEIDRQMAQALDISLGETYEEKINNVPLGKGNGAKDVAGLVSFLASEKANYMTGQAVVIDGGNVFS